MFPISDTKTSGHFPFLTIGLIAINVYVFFLQLTSPDLEAFIRQYALVPALVSLSDPSTWAPFITSQFLHGDFLHIIGNMVFLWVFGDNIEHRFGIGYIPFYLLGGAIAGLSQYFLNSGSEIPMLGASGAVAAVLGAYLVLYPHHVVKTLVIAFGFITTTTLPATFLLIYWFVIQVIAGVTALGIQTAEDVGGVAYFAHIGGFVFGWVLAQPFKLPPPVEDQKLKEEDSNPLSRFLD